MSMHQLHYPAKTEDSGALAKNPHAIFEYCTPRMGESYHAKQLRLEGAMLERPAMMGGPDVAGLLAWFVRFAGAKKILEVGTFRGTTAMWLAEAAPSDGKVVTLDVDATAAEMGMAHWHKAGLHNKIDFRSGDALKTITHMLQVENQAGTFDLVFLDADKINYPRYYELALELLKPNGMLAIDNTLWGGLVALQKPEEMDEITSVIAALNDKIAADPRVDAALIPLSDGLTMVRKLQVPGTPSAMTTQPMLRAGF